MTDPQSPEFLLHKATVMFGRDLALTGQYRWLWEGERWNEFVFALLVQALDQPESDVRQIVGILDALDLLDISQLAKIPFRDPKSTVQDSLGGRIIAVLTDVGADQDSALGRFTIKVRVRP